MAGPKIRKGRPSNLSQHISRSVAVRKLQVRLADFRKLCIFKGVYPRQPKRRPKRPDQTYYHSKDIKFILHDPLLAKFRAQKAYEKKIRRALARDEKPIARHLIARRPSYTLYHVVKQRYPTLVSCLQELDDALCTLALFASLSVDDDHEVTSKAVAEATMLFDEFLLFASQQRLMRKVFCSVKGFYFEIAYLGQTIRFLIPHQFPQTLPHEVDFSILLNFLELYSCVMKSVNFKIYQLENLQYPPTVNAAMAQAGARYLALRADSVSHVPAGNQENRKNEGPTQSLTRGDTRERRLAATTENNGAQNNEDGDGGVGGGGDVDGDVEMEKRTKDEVEAKVSRIKANLENVKRRMFDGEYRKESRNTEDEEDDGDETEAGGENEDEADNNKKDKATETDLDNHKNDSKNDDDNIDNDFIDEDNDNDNNRIFEFSESDTKKKLDKTSEDERRLKNLFKGKIFFVSREVPMVPVVFALQSCGATAVGCQTCQMTSSDLKEDDERITHHVLDRPVTDALSQYQSSREFIQPQWIFDSINNSVCLPVGPYRSGIPPPPHLSPFIDDLKEGYIPQQRIELQRLTEELKARELLMGDADEDREEEGGDDGEEEEEEEEDVGEEEDGGDIDFIEAEEVINQQQLQEEIEAVNPAAAVPESADAGPAAPAGIFGFFPDAETQTSDDTVKKEHLTEAYLNSKRKQRREEKKAEKRERQKSLLSKKHKRLLERIEFGKSRNVEKISKLKSRSLNSAK